MKNSDSFREDVLLEELEDNLNIPKEDSGLYDAPDKEPDTPAIVD